MRDVFNNEFELMQDVMIPMRDGVRLATDIYIPKSKKNNSFPVIIERTPYNKEAFSRSEINADGYKISRVEMAKRLTQHGFVVIFQDCRGRYKSEGVFVKYLNEAFDGFDSLNWIMQQPWCNGNIGSMGLSYAAHTQLAMACLNPAGLKTMILDSGGFANAYQSGIRQGGAFELKQATWAYKQAKLSPQAKQNDVLLKSLEQENITQWFKKMPWIVGASPLRHIKEYEDYLFNQWQAGEFNEDWQQLGIYAEGYYQDIPDIPVLFMSSWYDAYVASTLQNFQAFKKLKKSPQSLIMGSWLHGDRNISYSGDVEFGEIAKFDTNFSMDWLDYRLNWFKQHLKQDTQLTTPAVQMFLMGGGSGKKDTSNRLIHGGKWLIDDNFPLKNTIMQTFYLDEKYKLHDNISIKQGEYILSSDPNNPVPTIGGSITSGKPVFVGGAFNQIESADFFGCDGSNQPLNARHDILSFYSDTLTQDVILAGEVIIELWVSSDCVDCDFTAKLIDLYPPSEDYPQGYAMNITDGIIRSRYRDSWSNPSLLEPHKTFKVTIKPFESCNLFKQGHKIRLDIAGSNFPHFDCNPNSGEIEGCARSKKIATNSIKFGSITPSALHLRILKV